MTAEVTAYVYEPDLYDWEGKAVQVLITVFPNGKQTLATRSRPDQSWGPPELPVITG